MKIKYYIPVGLFIVLCIVVFNETLQANPMQDANEPENYFEMPLEQLLEVPVVISASRQEQKITQTSVPISIVTAEDIHYSGLTNIPDILKYFVGTDVVWNDRVSAATGIRGFHEIYSDRVLTMIDGCVADNPFFGGSQFYRLPIFIEDIEQIEIVRGPGSAAWGANAFTGTINIITKDLKDTQGIFSSTTWTEYGDNYNHLRWGSKAGKWNWRVSTGYDDTKSSENAIHDDDFTSSDFARKSTIGINTDFQASESTKWLFGIGFARYDLGNTDYDRTWFEETRAFAKVEHNFDDGGSGNLQVFSHGSNVHIESIGLRDNDMEHGIEGQLNFAPIGKHNITVGANIKATHIATTDSSDYFEYVGTPDTEYFAGAFVIDQYDITDRFWLEGQLRGDWYSRTQTDLAARVSAFYALNDNKDHVLKLSTAKAFRTPFSGLSRMQNQMSLLAPNIYWFETFPNDELRNEETWSLEAGYSGNINKYFSCSTNVYYQRFYNLVGLNQWTEAYGPFILYRSTYDNLKGADSYGLELDSTFKYHNISLSAWYAYSELSLDDTDQDIRAFEPAHNKFGLRGRLSLPDDWTLNANYRFTGDQLDAYKAVYPSDQKLDITLAKGIFKGRGELMFGVTDLLNKKNAAHTLDPSQEIPGQTFFARLQLKF